MAQVFLDRLSKAAHVESVVVQDSAIKNGQFLKLGVLDTDGERRVATKSTGDADAEVFLADAPVDYGYVNVDGTTFDLDRYELVAGKTGRAIHVAKGEIISVSEDLVTGEVKVGDELSVNDNGLGFKKATGKGIALLIGQEAQGFVGKAYVVAFK